VYLRGNYRQKGIPVAPATPAFLHAMSPDPGPSRLSLARWIAAPNNPLTARVMVNRIWQELFGRGIVSTSENFGTLGDRPSHPALLDWLASEFRDDRSMKRMIRRIVQSATYRQSSLARPELLNLDPNNALLARQVRLRLPAELIRDSALWASGLLDPTVGGKSVRPPQPDGAVKQLRGTWKNSEGGDRYRRGLYVQYQRMSPYPQLVNFDMPSGYGPACRRQRSNTPLQALNLLNDVVFVEAAQALAARVLAETPADPAARVDSLFRLCLLRPPDSLERDSLLASLERQKQILRSNPESAAKLFPIEQPGIDRLEAGAWVGICSVVLNLDEFITRE
jgi:hypothetical protein